MGIIGKGIMPEQCRHNRGSLCRVFFFFLSGNNKEIVQEFVPLCGTNVYMHMHIESLWRELEL